MATDCPTPHGRGKVPLPEKAALTIRRARPGPLGGRVKQLLA